MPAGSRSRRSFYAPMLNTGCVLDYFPKHVGYSGQPDSITAAVDDLERQCQRLLQDGLRKGTPADSSSPYFSNRDLQRLEKLGLAQIVSGSMGKAWFLLFVSTFLRGQPRPVAGRLSRPEGRRLVLVSHQASRISELLEEKSIHAAPHDSIEQPPEPGSVTVVQGSLAQGWALKEAAASPTLVVLSDSEILGSAKEQRLPRHRPVHHQLLRSEITPVDVVLHVDHGIARFAGTTPMRLHGVHREHLRWPRYGPHLRPSESMDRVNHYMGAGGAPPLSRLRSTTAAGQGART